MPPVVLLASYSQCPGTSMQNHWIYVHGGVCGQKDHLRMDSEALQLLTSPQPCASDVQSLYTTRCQGETVCEWIAGIYMIAHATMVSLAMVISQPLQMFV